MSRIHASRRFNRTQGVKPPALPRNAVQHGDCITVLASLPAGSVDFVLTDPPSTRTWTTASALNAKALHRFAFYDNGSGEKERSAFVWRPPHYTIPHAL